MLGAFKPCHTAQGYEGCDGWRHRQSAKRRAGPFDGRTSGATR